MKNMEQGEGNIEQGEGNMEQGEGNMEQGEGNMEQKGECGTYGTGRGKRTWSGGFGERQR